jgi:uncharacterized lipoprotein YmbA
VPGLTRTPTIHLLFLAILLAPAGCFSLSRSAPPQQHYVLGAGQAPESSATPADQPVADGDVHVIGLRQPRLADYLATPFIVVRRGSHQVEFSEYHRWGEDLGRSINRAVAGRVVAAGRTVARVPPLRVEAAPWPGGTSPEHVIQVHVLRFEGVVPEDPGSGEGEAHLLAAWEIFRSLDGALVGQGSTEMRAGGWSVGDFGGLVRLLDAGLDDLAEDLVTGLQRALVP